VSFAKLWLVGYFSSAFNGLFVYQWQDREKPKNVPCPQGIHLLYKLSYT